MREIKFRAWVNDGYMAIQGEPDLETLSSFMFHYSDQEKLMQFTGLKDKNGKDIFEGDIFSEMWKSEVYKDITGTYMVKFHTNPKINKPLILCKYLKNRERAGTDDRDCIIIGNIYENPELL